MKYVEWLLNTVTAAVMLVLIVFVAALAVHVHQRGGCIERSEWHVGSDTTFAAGTYCSRWGGERR